MAAPTTSTSTTTSTTTSTSTTTTLIDVLVPADATYDLLLPEGYAPASETLTNVLRLRKPTDGNTDWGDAVREAFDIVDMAIAAARMRNEDIVGAPVGSTVEIDALAESFRLTTSAYSEEQIGVTLDPIPADGQGLVKISGHAWVRTTGSVNIGDYLYTSSSKGIAQASSSRRAGAFARALGEPDKHNYVRAILLPGIADSPVQTLRIRVSATDAGDEWELSVMRAEKDLEISKVHAIMDANVIGNDVNFCELSFQNKALTAEINDWVFSLGNDAVLFVPIDFSTPDPTNKSLSEGEVATLRKTDSGGGLALPAFVLQVEYVWV